MAAAGCFATAVVGLIGPVACWSLVTKLVADLARDYDRPEAQIEETIRCELALPTAA